jgi:hypothetical protein
MVRLGALLGRSPKDKSEPKPVKQPARAAADGPPIIVMIPDVAGVSSFRIYSYPDAQGAVRFLTSLSRQQRERAHAFWALQHEPSDMLEGEDSGGEAMVLIRSSDGSDLVYIVSFLDIESAQSFARFEVKRGMHLGLILVYWASMVNVVLNDDGVQLIPEFPPRIDRRRQRTAASTVKAPHLPSLAETSETEEVQPAVQESNGLQGAPSAAQEQGPLETELEEQRRRLEAEAAEQRQLAAAAEERRRLEADAAEQRRLEAEAAEQRRQEAEAEQKRLASDAEEQGRLEAQAEQRRLEAEAEQRRLESEAEEQRRLEAEAEEQRLAAEAEQQRLAAEAEERSREAEAERQRLEAEAEQRRLEAEAAEQRRLEAEAEEQRRLAAEAEEQRRLEAEAEEQRRLEAEAEQRRLEAEEEERRLQAEAEQRRLEAEAEEERRLEAEAEQRRLEAEAEEQGRLVAEAEQRRLEAEAAEQRRLEAEWAMARVAAGAEAEERRMAAEIEEQQRLEAEEQRLFEEQKQRIFAAAQADEDLAAVGGPSEALDNGEHSDAQWPEEPAVNPIEELLRRDAASRVEVPSEFARKPRGDASEEPQAEGDDEGSGIEHDVSKILRKRRWEKRESPFEGFKSPPGRF